MPRSFTGIAEIEQAPVRDALPSQSWVHHDPETVFGSDVAFGARVVQAEKRPSRGSGLNAYHGVSVGRSGFSYSFGEQIARLQPIAG